MGGCEENGNPGRAIAKKERVRGKKMEFWRKAKPYKLVSRTDESEVRQVWGGLVDKSS